MNENIIQPIVDLIKILFRLKPAIIFFIFNVIVYVLTFRIPILPEFIENQKAWCYVLGIFYITVIIVNICCIVYNKLNKTDIYEEFVERKHYVDVLKQIEKMLCLNN